MAKDIRYHFYLKDINSKAPTPINCALNKGNFRKKIAIGETILPKWWDIENERAIEDNRQKKAEKALSKRVNRSLSHIRERLDEVIGEYIGLDKLSPNHTDGDDYIQEVFEKAKSIINGNAEEEQKKDKASRQTPTEFFQIFIDKWSKTPNPRTGIIPKKETIVNYKNTLRRYKEFIHDNNLKDTFAIFDEDFQAKFDDYLINEQELTMNSIAGSHSQLKTMLRVAFDRGLLKNTSFKKWTSKSVKFTKIYLTDAELTKLHNLKLTNKIKKDKKIGKESHIEESKDLFIISARTGLRYSDLTHLDTATWNMEEGKESLTILIKKTNGRLTIPLHTNVIEIYNKYGGNLPKVVDKSKYNLHIRKCAEIAEINENIESFTWVKGRPQIKNFKKYQLISSHTGRRSFATNLYLVCKSASYTMSLTGHTSEENFRRYICVNQAEMAEMLRKYINLDYKEATTNETFEKFVRTLKEDTLTIERQKGEIDKLEKEKQSAIQMVSIAESQKKDAENELSTTEEAWRMGLTIEEYEEIKRKGDEIAAIVDYQEYANNSNS